ncbi:tRNA-dihydrouridine synthase family protein [Desulfobacter hydrogenophilus]|uniref:tRNA-dihydrouridine synthase n=1 Tax=Desulfobacter hydrogenophilus TaxID=2291 RepID=A0A328FH97_9BACT|nr:tRNA-dihydrouridine synthase family protein [Desulfobacter hydrogenophilus]NDY73380.1 tRNA-dihydrouridine synthase family protein [Desulfobacter hydrogenophilus]QBH12964.1 tRNA-dihydrouridine synthase family protein [Desulfobacter hydrogenophilus]RAM03948.1 tRNA-dihydrouridine synthase family protein [Desulfobacter hydrogenophilus]
MADNRPFLILAPLQGVTDVVFRQAYVRHFNGIDQAMAPFISTMSSRRLKPSRLKDVDPALNTALPVIPQILGNDPDDFIYLGDSLFDMGYAQVNWNLGCPHSKIAKKLRGSGLLSHPDKIDAFLSRVIPVMKPALSVKIRLGRKSKEEIRDLIAMFNAHKLDEIILHPRTGEQMYTGAVDVDAFEAAMNACDHPMVYNGDIVDSASWEIIRQRFPDISRFMIGRGVLSNPFLPEQIKGMNIDSQNTDFQRRERLKKFYADLFNSYKQVFSGPGHLIGRMKGFWNYLGPSFENSKKPLKKLLKSNSEQDYLDRVNEFWGMNLKFCPGRIE